MSGFSSSCWCPVGELCGGWCKFQSVCLGVGLVTHVAGTVPCRQGIGSDASDGVGVQHSGISTAVRVRVRVARGAVHMPLVGCAQCGVCMRSLRRLKIRDKKRMFHA